MKQFLLMMTLAGLCAMAQTTVLDISFTPEQMKDIKLPDCAKIDVIDGTRKSMSSTEIHALQ